MEKTDTHTHTYLSNHGEGTVEEVVQTALSQGMTTIALTEHLPLPDEANPYGVFAMHESDVGLYLDSIGEARKAHPDIEIICGTEIDWRHGAEDYIMERIAPFELKLGSVHMAQDEGDGHYWAFDTESFDDEWDARGEKAVWQKYFDLWLEAVNSSIPFDIMTHPDLPKKLCHKPTFDVSEQYAAMASAAAQRGVMIELNTAGLRKPVHEFYPGPELLRAFCNEGVPCTVSSDAHTPSDVGRDFDAAYIALQEAGYKCVTVPTRNGDRREIPFD
ncbi:MAG: histidinol-phosphatase [Coriobacteriales bacterium]|jgi:histidinol-phosphatase (PHP family)|nr:histidinol-phosphatase [Coriobacteriales bacterium]